MPPESLLLERTRRSLLDLFSRWGYEIVTPPFIEYLESLLTGTGEDLELHTFKLLDQLTGRMMGVRADMTPQVARIDARRLRRDGPSRLCYAGTVLHTLPEGISGGRSPVQIGAELYGHPGWESDCEIVRLMLEALSLAGVGPIHLDMGHVGIFRALARRAALPHEREIALHEALQRKAGSEVRELLDAWAVDAGCAGALRALVDLDGDPSILERAGRGARGGRGGGRARTVRSRRAGSRRARASTGRGAARGSGRAARVPLPHRVRVRRIRAGARTGGGERRTLRRDRQRLRPRAGGDRIQRGFENAHRLAGIGRRLRPRGRGQCALVGRFRVARRHPRASIAGCAGDSAPAGRGPRRCSTPGPVRDDRWVVVDDTVPARSPSPTQEEFRE